MVLFHKIPRPWTGSLHHHRLPQLQNLRRFEVCHNWKSFSFQLFLHSMSHLTVHYMFRHRSSRRGSNDNLSIVLMVIVVSFLVCNSLRISLNMHEITVIKEITLCRCTSLGGFPVHVIFLGFVSQVMLVLNSAINMIIYCLCNTEFR